MPQLGLSFSSLFKIWLKSYLALSIYTCILQALFSKSKGSKQIAQPTISKNTPKMYLQAHFKRVMHASCSVHQAGQERKWGMLAFSTATGKHSVIFWLVTSGTLQNWLWKADGNRTGYVPIWCGLKLPPCNQRSPDSWGTETSNASQQLTGFLLHLKDSPKSSVLPSQLISPATFTQNCGRPEGDGHSSIVLSHSFLKPWGRT